jgi:hypothetical protein
VLEVPVGQLVGVALHRRRRPGHGVEHLGVLGELPELEAEEPGPLPVDEHDGEAFVGLEDRLQRPDVGRVVHHHPVADGQRRLDDLEEIVGRTGEEGQPPHPRAVEPGPDPGGDPVEVGGHRPGGLRPEGRRPLLAPAAQMVELGPVVGGAGQAAPVDVEVAARDHGGGLVAGQGPDPVLVDHVISLPPPGTYGPPPGTYGRGSPEGVPPAGDAGGQCYGL